MLEISRTLGIQIALDSVDVGLVRLYNRANFWMSGLITMGTELSELFAKVRTGIDP